MGRIASSLVLGACVVLLGACAPRVQVAMLGEVGEASRLAGPEDMALFSTRTPECPYREIALVTAYADEILGDPDEALEALKVRAWELGADALLGLRTVNSGGEDPEEGYSATAVRFERDDCLR